MDLGDVVVDDRAETLAVGDDGVGDVGDVDEEGLVGLRGEVAVDQHVEGVGRAAGGDRLAGQRLGRVVARSRGRAVE